MEMTGRLGQIVASFVASVEGVFAAPCRWPGHDQLYVVERATRRAMLHVGRLVLQTLVDSKHGGHRGHRWVDEEGREWTFRQYLSREVESVVGPVTVRAAQYYDAQAEPRTTVPHYQELGLPSGRYSRGMEEAVALAGAEDVYREGLALINRLTEAAVSVHKAETAIGSWGTEAKERPRGDPPARCREDDPRKLLADAHRYFVRNTERMDYAAYRAKGYPIGSGVVESSRRHIVGLRMKRTATMTWTERNAEAMIQLRCLRASGAWDRFWGFDKLWGRIRASAA